MDAANRTHATCEKLAADCASYNRDRSKIQTEIERFLELTRPGGLVLDVG